jgi:hypothetical protein
MKALGISLGLMAVGLLLFLDEQNSRPRPYQRSASAGFVNVVAPRHSMVGRQQHDANSEAKISPQDTFGDTS